MCYFVNIKVVNNVQSVLNNQELFYPGMFNS